MRRSQLLLLTGLLLFGAAVRVWLLDRSHWMVEGDEAMTGLLAKHILEGERPVFLPAQAYMGTLQAYAAALLYPVLGMSREALKLVPLAASLGLMLTTYWLARRALSPHAAAVAAAVAALPPIYVAANTLKTLGPYTEVMALGNAMLALTIGLGWANHARPASAGLLGALAAFSFWLNPIAAYYQATCPLVLLAKLRAGAVRLLPAGLGGFALGGIPLWIGNLNNDFEHFRFLTGGGSGGPDVGALAVHLVEDPLPRVLGLSQPWGETPAPLAWGLGAILAAATLALLVRGRRTHGLALAPSDVPLVFALVAALVYLFSGFGGPALNPWGIDATGRYVVPLWSVVPLAVAALAEVVRRLWLPLSPTLVTLVLGAHLFGYPASDPARVFQSPYWDKLPLRSDDLIAHLHANDIGHVWMNHWGGFPLMLDTQESIIAADYYDVFVGGGANRFPRHFDTLESADRAAYVLVTDRADPHLVQRLRELEVAFSETRVGPYVVVQPLSRPIHPSEVADAIGYDY